MYINNEGQLECLDEPVAESLLHCDHLGAGVGAGKRLISSKLCCPRRASTSTHWALSLGVFSQDGAISYHRDLMFLFLKSVSILGSPASNRPRACLKCMTLQRMM